MTRCHQGLYLSNQLKV